MAISVTLDDIWNNFSDAIANLNNPEYALSHLVKLQSSVKEHLISETPSKSHA
jgi:hypothetical protein